MKQVLIVILALAMLLGCGSPTEPPPESCLQFAGNCDLGLDSIPPIFLPPITPPRDTVTLTPPCGKGHDKVNQGHNGRHRCDND